MDGKQKQIYWQLELIENKFENLLKIIKYQESYIMDHNQILKTRQNSREKDTLPAILIYWDNVFLLICKYFSR